MALNIPEYEGVFYLRHQVYAFVKKLSPPFKCPPSAEALRLMHQISKDPLIEVPLQDGSLLADLVRDDKKTLTLVAPDLEGYTDEEEPLTMGQVHATDQTVADDQHHESEMRETINIPEVALPAQEVEHDKDVSEITELYTTQEIARQEDFRNGNGTQPSCELARAAHNFTTGSRSTSCDLRAYDSATKTPTSNSPTRASRTDKDVSHRERTSGNLHAHDKDLITPTKCHTSSDELTSLLKRWQTEGEDLAEKKRQYLAEYGQRQRLVQYGQPQHLVLTAESAKQADLTEEADIEYLAGLPEQADLEFLTSLHESTITMAASAPQDLAANDADQADINFLNGKIGLHTPFTMVQDAEVTSVAHGLPANEAEQADINHLIEQMSLRTLLAKGQDDKTTSGAKELDEGDAEEADIEYLTGQKGIHTPPSSAAQELETGDAERADIAYLIEHMWLRSPPGTYQDTTVTSGEQGLGAGDIELEDIQYLADLMRFRTPPPKRQVASQVTSPISTPQGLGAGLAVSTADISLVNDEAVRPVYHKSDT